MNFRIQRATIRNLKDIQKFSTLLFKHEHKKFDKTLKIPWSLGTEGKKFFKIRVSSKKYCSLIAYIEKTPVGYLTGGIIKPITYRKIPRMAQLENMYVLEKYRSHGIGRELYDEFICWCINNKVGRIKVSAMTKNIRAIEFYKKTGFRERELVLESSIHFSNTP